MLHKFTIFTPTYNRANTLHRVFDSLKQQTFTDFEWLIVDDGSTDSTQKLVEQFKTDATFPIQYFYQANQGKHIAFNKGVQEAKGLFFLTFDSDDACVANALEIFNHYWETIEDKEKFCGVTARCYNQQLTPLSKKTFPAILDVNAHDLHYKQGINEEMWGFTRTDILRQFPYPTTLTKAWVPEAIVWSKIANLYKTRFINQFVRIYYINESHGSLITAMKTDRKTDDTGRILYYAFAANNDLKYFFHAPFLVGKLFIQYVRCSLKEKISLAIQLSHMKGIIAKCLFVGFFPIGFLFFLKDYIVKK